MTQGDLGARFREETDRLIQSLSERLPDIVARTDERRTLAENTEAVLEGFHKPLPETGNGGAETIETLIRLNEEAGGNTAGPRCYHFVIGGNTPAAHCAELLAAAYDTITYTWILSPAGVEMERQALNWLKELLGLPAAWPGVMVTGASMANFVCLAAARQWWGEQHGVDVSEAGLAGLPQMPVLTSGFVHASALKVFATQGVGRGNVQVYAKDEHGRLDLDGFRRGLEALDGKPAVVVANAGEVNGGEFDPTDEMIDAARDHNCWVHVDGAFGLFAAVSPRTAHLVQGVERADSATVDGHKWLNVPYDSGYAFVRDYGLMARAFRYSADYLPLENEARPTAIGPESSRRARSFAVWATLNAYGRSGHRQLVEHCLDIAQHFADVVRDHPRLEAMNEPELNIVPFRYNPGGRTDAELDVLNARLGEAVIDDGRFLVGTSRYGARTVFRPAFSNWRTRPADVEGLAQVVVEIGDGLTTNA